MSRLPPHLNERQFTPLGRSEADGPLPPIDGR